MRVSSSLTLRLGSLTSAAAGVLALALGVALAPAGEALADVVGPLPPDCVRGSEAVFCHGPPTCRVLACASDTDCSDGRVCRPARLCIEPHSCGGIAGAPVYDHAISACSDVGCAAGTCTPTSVCVSVPGFDGGPSIDASAGTDVGSSRDVGLGAPDAPTPIDTGTARVDTGTGAFVTTYGCGCRATGPVGDSVLSRLAVFALCVGSVGARVLRRRRAREVARLGAR